MRKKLVLLISCICVAFVGMAQNEEEVLFTQRPGKTPQTNNAGRKVGTSFKTYGYEMSIGLRAGGGLAMMSDSKDLKVSDGSGFSYDAGFALNLRFGNKDSKGRPLHGQGLVGVGLELNYAAYSIKTVADKNLDLGYFEVPLLLQLYPAYQTKQLKNLYIEVGPTFSALISKSPDELQTDQYTTFITGDLKGGDIKGTVGLGYRVNRGGANDGFYINLRYNHGFSKLAGNFPSKISSAELTIGYLFKCVGGKGKNNTALKPNINR